MKRDRSAAMKHSGKKKPRFSFGAFLYGALRWGVAGLLVSLIVGSYVTSQNARLEAGSLNDQVTTLEHEKTGLQEEIARFTDPEWRENYWKWRTMRHEPGEYYIDFTEPGVL